MRCYIRSHTQLGWDEKIYQDFVNNLWVNDSDITLLIHYNLNLIF